ncbi:ATP-binding cassette domain-containing protein [Sulfurovum sp. TSL1]|uniref:thiamine ABC transporter ATP-binding protein n=1 Tax=Sulfurovum sp. TSL1 TaxID=2826994 RepID=UPI001CC74CA9|nr:ATP-binding cassette domain-containing protein [Sulfurovum sp. TSL1]GIT99230.1 thiamine import ATP-binding protein ThiQ [Sulfurovum sp. TSL1]
MLKITDVKYQHKNADDTYEYSMTVKSKEIVAILGQSGSGKSTFLDLLAGFLPAKSGSIKLDDNELIDKTVEKRPISILFQNDNLFEHLSVQKNILLGISKTLKSTPEALSKVKTILKEVGLEKYEQTLVSSLSGGQQQRVALARVLLRREPVLLLDEPFTGLDKDTRSAMLDLVKKITIENNLHTLMVTHEIEDCERIADRVYKVENQKLVEQ